ncbi:substrate-binding domain-containing protein [Jiangella mangrovi]|uniref:ABC-type Fe3+ transport system substrate-binding protein n=1 Tax=Jiangella mangrovi TaxID=1524084 RepID=A0A7W9GSV2_9ACTN|nr:substrate-binding domain-containing protein [Jiangella mangrovi]MBB5789081.1 ABC-type Fe3+ transport system substrate-binding protein [Jiangella mangrovi]
MPGRHASHRQAAPTPWLRRLGLSVMAVALIGAAGLGVASVLDRGTGDCAGPLAVTVAADPTIEPVLTELGRSYAETDPRQGDRCVQIDVNAAASGAVVGTLGSAEAPHLWVPKTRAFGPAVEEGAATELASVALSPLVVVMPSQAAEAIGGSEAEISWTALVQGEGPAVIADPAANDEGIASLIAVRTALGENVDRTQLVQLMTQVSQAAVPTVGDAFAAVAESPAAFTATEQAVAAYNRDAGDARVTALYPAEGTLAFDYPALAVTGADEDEAARSAAAAFVTYLGSTDAQEAIRRAGFRSPDGTADRNAGVVDGTRQAMPALLPDPDPAAVTELSRQWAALALDMRMLAVIDVSGSMNEQVTDDATRIELTRDAALEALQLFPPDASVGLWAFSILQDPPNDYVQLVDVGPMNEPTEDGTLRGEALAAAAASLPDIADGGTGLYDTALAAFQEMRSSYQAGMVNSVVLLTDGRNEDDPEGIDLETLLTQLTAQFDPAAPVPIITIGMGPEADMEALQQISAATGTTAYHAEDPSDIQSVFLQAMIERQCRPNC